MAAAAGIAMTLSATATSRPTTGFLASVGRPLGPMMAAPRAHAGASLRQEVRCMAGKKGVRVIITLECTECRTNDNQRRNGVNRYSSEKNRRNHPERIELRKHCPCCNKHTIHKEIK